MTDTNRLDSLRALHDAVKAGAATAKHFRACWPGYMGTDTPNALNAARAAEGSLDAAHALHQTVLPGWEWNRVVHRWPIPSVGVWRPPKFVIGQMAREVDGNTARAWLLAILSALIAQEAE